MNPRALFFGGVAALCVFAIGLGWHAWRRASEAEAARMQLEREQAETRAALVEWRARAATAEQERGRLREALAAAAKPKPATTASKAAQPTLAERMEREPQLQILALANERAQVLATYGALFRKLGLTPEQMAAFQEGAFRRRERMMDLQAVMQAKGLSWADSAIQKLRSEAETEFKAAQRALLGEEGYRKFEDYERTSWLREMMRGWAGGAAVVLREPFTPEQGERLMEILAHASESYRGGGHAFTDDPGYWAAVTAEARKILTPTQFDYFSTAEPPLPVGARFQSQFYDTVRKSLEKEKATVGAGGKPRGG